MNNYFSLRKRGLALFVALMMCLSMLPGTAMAATTGAKCSNCSRYTVSYQEANGEFHSSYCSTCGTFAWNAGSHNVVDGVCTVCGWGSPQPSLPQPEPTECKHQNTALKSNGNGHDKYCTDCDELLEKGIAHVYKDGQCECGATEKHVCKDFDEKHHCTYCGKLNPEHTHDFDKSGKCDCGEQHTTHNVTSWKTDHVGNPDMHTGTCADCDQVVTEAHTFGPVSWGRKTCTKCGYYVDNTSEPEHTHDYTYTYSGNNKHMGDCKSEDGTCTAKTIIEGCVFDQKGPDTTRDYCICGNSKSNVVDLEPGRPECSHVYGTNVTSVGEYKHKLTCIDCGHEEIESCTPQTLVVDGQPVVHYCTVCGYQVSIEIPEKPYCTDLTGGHKLEITKEVIDGDVVLTTLECTKCPYTEVKQICTHPNKVTVHYVDETGKTIAPDGTQIVIKGTPYSITSPTIEGYTPDKAVVSGTSAEGKDEEFTVTYKKNPGTVKYTVRWIDADTGSELQTADVREGKLGDWVKPAETDKVVKGYTYVKSQSDDDGFRLDSGKVEIKLFFKKEIGTHTLTIKYEKQGGEEVFEAYVAELKAGETYEVKSHELHGYKTEQEYVKGTMPDADEKVTVKYEPIEYTWTIKYVDENDNRLENPYETTYTVETVKGLTTPANPDVPGYKVKTENVTLPDSQMLGNVEGKVVYEPIEYTWTINYVDENGDTVADSFTKTFTVNDFKTLDAETSPVINGYTADKPVVAAPTELKNVTATVIYTATKPDTFTVTWENGYTDTPIKAETLDEGDSYEDLYPNDPTREGYEFTGWGEPVEDADGNVTITATWRPVVAEPDTFTVTWENGYNDTPIKTETLDEGDSYEDLYPNDPTREGYEFTGWGEPVEDADGNVTITATWRELEDEEEPTPTPTPTPTPDPVFPTPDPTPAAPADPGMNILDEETPLGGTVGLNTTNHFAYIIGYDDGTVRPLANITRAEAVTIFFRLMTDEYRNANWSTTNSFADVNAGDWYNNAISTCLKAGALEPFAKDANFLPNQAITRAEFAALAAGFIDETYTGETVGDFSDTEGHWAAEYIRKAVEAGWITGSGNAFRPDELITRADVMTMVNRMLDRVPDAEHMLPTMKTWSDNPEGTWYYEAVQEATNEHAYERDELGIVETWTELLEIRDWKALEEEWAENNETPSVPETEGGDE